MGHSRLLSVCIGTNVNFESHSLRQSFPCTFNSLRASFFSRTQYVPRLKRIERFLRNLRFAQFLRPFYFCIAC